MKRKQTLFMIAVDLKIHRQPKNCPMRPPGIGARWPPVASIGLLRVRFDILGPVRATAYLLNKTV